ncbi:TIR domain-containing protein, partial [Endothiovibrio diazotrophicus]
LRSGQDWRRKLEEQVPNKDIFYLFWSQSASCSEWVEREWRIALSKRGIRYIDPVPLEGPEYAPPPLELSSLHFNDAYLAYISYARMKQESRPRRAD